MVDEVVELPITAGTDPVEPKKCKGKRCRNYLAKDAKLPYCRRCHAMHVRRGAAISKARRAPGVDIDAIHFNPRWMKKKEAA